MELSVVIATRDRARLLEGTLEHLARQQAPGIRWEVVVVDNGSSDDTPAVLERAAARLPLVRLAEPRPGKNRALNRALEVARGELLLFTDDDVIPDPRWVAEMVGAARRWPDAAVFGGRVELAYPPGTPGWLRDPVHPALNFARFDFDRPEGPIELPPNGPNLALRRSALAGLRFREDIGPDGTRDYAMGSETELLDRLRARGATTIYVPGALVHHVVQPAQLATRALLRRSFRLGRGQVRRAPKPARPVVRLFGIPRYLWRELATRGLRWALNAPLGRRRRLGAGLELWNTLGQIAEHRSAARAAAGATADRRRADGEARA